MMPYIQRILCNFSFPFNPMFIDKMYCVKDEQWLKGSQAGS